VKKFASVLSIALTVIVVAKINSMDDLTMVDAMQVQTVVQASTVDRASAPTDGICHLARLPVDVMNYIAQLLDLDYGETEAEFIERTCVPKKVRNEHCESLLARTEEGPFSRTLKAAYCPDQTKFVLLEIFTGMYCPKDTLTIFNLRTKKIMYTQNPDRTHVCFVGLAQSAPMLAFIHQHETSTEYKDILVIKNVVTRAKQEFSIPDNFFKIVSIGFNMQGTHAIVHGTYYRELDQSAVRGHLIFPLEPEAQAKSEKTLKDYFRRRQICNNIAMPNNSK
jgi:hypothetical protein